MQESPIEKINKQFEILKEWKNEFLIKEYIPPKIETRKIIYRNDVVQKKGERSLKAQKYFNYCQQYIAFFKSNDAVQ